MIKQSLKTLDFSQHEQNGDCALAQASAAPNHPAKQNCISEKRQEIMWKHYDRWLQRHQDLPQSLIDQRRESIQWLIESMSDCGGNSQTQACTPHFWFRLKWANRTTVHAAFTFRFKLEQVPFPCICIDFHMFDCLLCHVMRMMILGQVVLPPNNFEHSGRWRNRKNQVSGRRRYTLCFGLVWFFISDHSCRRTHVHHCLHSNMNTTIRLFVSMRAAGTISEVNNGEKIGLIHEVGPVVWIVSQGWYCISSK